MTRFRDPPKTAPDHGRSIRGDHTGAGGHSATVGAAWTAAVLLCFIAAFHAAIVLGAPWGAYTQGGGTTGTLTLSGRIVAAVSCALSIGMAAAILSRVGHGPLGRLPTRAKAVLAWFTMAYAAIAVILNLITRSTHERTLWAPVSIVLLGLVAVVVFRTADKGVVQGE